jgi:putative heme-binding domain-containing protein
MEADIDRYRATVGSAAGNPRVGKKLFATHCGTCHMMFGEGGQSGPDLTSYQRQDVRGMIVHVVNPSLEIREGFENHMILTDDGRALNGLIADSDPQVVVLRDAASQTRVIARDEILEMSAVPQSLMPEGLLKPLSDQQIRDLFAYLRSTQPIP